MSQRRCPMCERLFDPEQSPALPFCSTRCRLADLNRWLNEGYGLPYDGRKRKKSGRRRRRKRIEVVDREKRSLGPLNVPVVEEFYGRGVLATLPHEREEPDAAFSDAEIRKV